jgi:membrane associated rhomboid family serine protease
MTPTPVGMRCPECAGERTRVRTAAGGFGAQGASRYPATIAFLVVNTVVFFAELAAGGGAASFSGGGSLINDGGLLGPAIAENDEWYRILTSGFLHAGPIHLLLNMFVLYVLGTMLEPAIGTARFVGVYLVSLLAGAFGALLLDPNVVTVGASGAVYGIMAAAFLIARGRGFEEIASQVGLWLVLNLLFTFSISGISIGGHLGGLVAGGLAALAILAGERGPARRALPMEALGLIAIGAVSVAGALWAAGQSTPTPLG